MTVVTDVIPKAAVSALSVEKVSHAYGARIALDDVSFDVAPASPCFWA
jgi:ABC-type phosphonate transport system ATPase subunit